ncbi:MAG: flagellar assembly protein FliX [Caulobacteraceae bacterium]
MTAAASVSAVSTLEALMALQEVGGPLERRRRAVWRGGQDSRRPGRPEDRAA